MQTNGPKTGKIGLKMSETCRKRLKSGPRWPFFERVSKLSGKKHSSGQYWAITTLVKQFSCRNADFWPKNCQKRPKNDPIFQKRAPEGPDLGKFVVFLGILSNWTQMSLVSGKKMVQSEKSHPDQGTTNGTPP